MKICEPVELLNQVTQKTDALVSAIFNNTNQIDMLDEQISIRSMIGEMEKHKHDLPRHLFNNYTIFHSNCLWESLKRKAATPDDVEIFISISPEDPMHFVWRYKRQYFHFRRAFGDPRAEVFLKGYIEPFSNKKAIRNLKRVDIFLK